MSHPDPGSRTSISSSRFVGDSSWSAPDRQARSIQEDSIGRNRTIYHPNTSTTTSILTQEGRPLGFEAHARTSDGHSQTGTDNMEGKGLGIDLTSSTSSSVVQNTSFFSGAHRFTVNNPIMVANGRLDIEREMLKLLEKKAMVDGTYNSAARYYTAPQCHPATRITLRERLIKWLLDMDREESLFWLYGPAGVGKSAISQNIMEYCTQQGIPGAGLFLSRANKRDDPNRIVPSFAHQLALAYPVYRRHISNVLSADSTILEKCLPLQFQKLIDEPADALRIDASNPTPHPILLLLDGLDECNIQEAQREFIKMLVSFASTCKVRRLPFVCIVTSRPEWQVLSTFDALGPTSGRVWHEELPMDTPEARRDVSTVLQDGFEHIKSKHSDAYSAGVEWPSLTDLQAIKHAASGNMLLASLVVAYVDDDDPTTKLELCLKSLQGKLTSDERNPFEPLTALYRGLVLSIPPTLLRTALLILYFQLLVDEDPGTYPYTDRIPAQATANFLFVEQIAFYGSLRRLRSVLSIPLPAYASLQKLVFSHTTFADYVKVVVQEGHFGLHEVDALTEIRTACIKWHHILVDRGTSEDISDVAPWAGTTSAYRIRTFLRPLLFKLWHGLPHLGNFGKLQDELEHFPFKDWPRKFIWSHRNNNLMRLARDLVANGTRSSTTSCIVRTEPLWPTDYQLIDKYAALFGQWTSEVKPLDWDSYSPSTRNDDVTLYFCSVEDPFDDGDAFDIFREIDWCPTLAYFLLGHNQNTVLVITRPTYGIDRDVYWKEAFEKIKTSHSISSTAANPCPPEKPLLCSHFYSKLNSLCSSEGGRKPYRIQSSFDLSCNIVSFIADPWHTHPHSRLKTVADILSFTTNPTEIIRLLYHHVLGDVPHEISRVAHQVLAFLVEAATGSVAVKVDDEVRTHFTRQLVCYGSMFEVVVVTENVELTVEY
ncbi:hypothetical protein D9756_010147 [Leucocoprinus leucothites]|uniref:Nephrocystin 3-like N-terminal domain-containing protein n=1 Tax=Leucocoprinus leucothites TaxID=201217 RepID=A0A8H5FSX1_9AGAR|nr:hypothetical protein D9756_010147 [Leucoagaricus leucothites]